jgi:hypothetical protein
MLYEFEFFRVTANAPKNTDEAPAIWHATRQFKHQEAAELYGIRNAAPRDAAVKADGFRLYADGKLKRTIMVSPRRSIA